MQAGECEVSLSLSLYEAEEPDTGERFAVVPGRWMCATPTRGNRGPTSTACLSLSLSRPLATHGYHSIAIYLYVFDEGILRVLFYVTKVRVRRIVANFGIGRELPRPRSSANIMYLFVISPFSSLSRKSVNGGFRAMKGEKFLLRLSFAPLFTRTVSRMFSFKLDYYVLQPCRRE